MEDKKNNHVEGCMCMGCRGYGRMGGGGHHWTFFLLRTLITVIILIIVFSFGVQVGRMTGFHRTASMMRMGTTPTGYNPGGPMIPATNATSSPVQGL
jgi:hypothetical protein